ncbi:unnamed protein product [Effrenium voratum]|nr:unnamed protein product [Effrenium voratum]|eukprot:CAMPEP_0181407720 /NCGR_PEP_ID=MMETSP1110-20121109/5924_1 /TAXON_ID=174948 /ORGANISM="Symbiodinium sp., Strain CCMP421" /LENGTH=736 /DNA_ID=CAMNT_0023530155 /DNA_START=21 /DNA_END=2231 /DNA_ORIENTATION=+
MSEAMPKPVLPPAALERRQETSELAIHCAVVWVNKAAKGSSQWSDTCCERQLAQYRFRKRLKTLNVLVKYVYMALALFETPSWCLVEPFCLEREGMYSWNFPLMPFQVSNTLEILCLLYLAQVCWRRRRTLGEAAKNSGWHIFRAVLILVALTDCAVAIFNTIGIVPGSFRLCRLCRPLIFMCHTKFIRLTLNRLGSAFLEFWTVLASLALCVIFFVWLAIVIFARSTEGQHHFSNWFASLASLWILFTTANFPDVMIDSYKESRASFCFFFVYLVISLYLLNNILLASVYDAYKEKLREQLRDFDEQKAVAIERAFCLLAEEEPEGAQAIGLQRWMTFFAAYCEHAVGPGSSRDDHFIRQRAFETFQALDSDGSGYISHEEFQLVVHSLSDPKIYIPLRPIPQVGNTCWGRSVRIVMQKGVKLPGGRMPWWMVVDLVVLLEILFAFAQTCKFVEGHFDDGRLMPSCVWFWLLTLTTLFLFADVVLQMITFGPERYWNNQRLRHRFDVFSISLLVGFEIAACIPACPPDFLLRTLLMLHISRAVCLVQHIKPLRYLVAMVAHLVPVYHQLGLLLFLVYYIFATLGIQLFGGLIYEGNEALAPTGFAAGEYWPLNFNDFPSGMVTLFVLMVVNNWFVVADGFMAVTDDSAAVFFVLFFVCANLVVLNILIALILDSSATVQDQLQARALHWQDGDAPQRSFSQGGREFLLRRLLMNDERLDTPHAERNPDRAVTFPR